jgi:hypothetical protein
VWAELEQVPVEAVDETSAGVPVAVELKLALEVKRLQPEEGTALSADSII